MGVEGVFVFVDQLFIVCFMCMGVRVGDYVVRLWMYFPEGFPPNNSPKRLPNSPEKKDRISGQFATPEVMVAVAYAWEHGVAAYPDVQIVTGGKTVLPYETEMPDWIWSKIREGTAARSYS